jgi:hypothetical protein
MGKQLQYKQHSYYEQHYTAYSQRQNQKIRYNAFHADVEGNTWDRQEYYFKPESMNINMTQNWEKQ